MKFNEHSQLIGEHSFLSPSKYSWTNYDLLKMESVYRNHLAQERGTDIHEFASHCIRLGQMLPKKDKTLNLYVNDAIRYRMSPEQPLVYSRNCFGTADAISFDDDLLRIHDLKTGVIPAHMRQLEAYAALFCLEYKMTPGSIGMELRLYQDDQVVCHSPEPDDICQIMEKVVQFDALIEKIKLEG